MAIKKTKLALLVARAIQQFVNPAFAQTSSPPAADASLPEIKVQGDKDLGYSPAFSSGATKSNAPLRDVPQTVNVIPQQLIQDQAARSMQDVLRNVPGVGMSNGDGQRDQVTIRGFSAIADQFIDGIRDDALYFRDLSNIERVEVLKGPAAVLYGRGSSGGLINRVTKKPQAGTFGEIALTLGSYDLKRTTFDVNAGANENINFRVTGAYEDSGSFRDQGFIERSSLAPSLSIKFTEDTKLLVQAEFSKDKRIT
ncbi:MAG: TonB-dependent receptor plug domain-containing protein, partial [Sideroxyarcus sp.]|nr:TonB-dependent receptor plug domain-containing protein [Sideroxyarcus sp.]